MKTPITDELFDKITTTVSAGNFDQAYFYKQLMLMKDTIGELEKTAQYFQIIEEALGSTQDDTSSSINIELDDAICDYIIRYDTKRYYGNSLKQALDKLNKDL